MLTDIEIAQSCEMQPIGKIAEKLNIPEEMLEPYGRYKAKVDHIALKDLPQKGRLVLVTAINPTPAGEGKTTVSIGLADALRLEGYNACLALREPSLGPVFGVKGGAAGGGYAQVVPMEDINLHFTGDMHAITRGEQPACRHAGQPASSRATPCWHRPAPHDVEALHGYERPAAPQRHRRPRRQAERHAARGRV